jgi:HEAT repeat protein
MLLEGLRETSEDQGQGYIALALGMIGDEQAVAPLKELVRASKYKPEIMEQASIALALLGDKSTAPELAEMLAKAQGQAAQASIATALGRIGDVRTIEPLLKLIDRKDLTASARAFAAAALGQVTDTDPMPWYTPIALDLNYVATTGTLLAGDGTGLLEIL